MLFVPKSIQVIGNPFATNTFWYKPQPAEIVVDTNNAAIVADLVKQSQTVAPYVNTWQYSAEVNVVPVDQPLVPVLVRGSRTDSAWKTLKKAFGGGIPIPEGWVPTADNDAHGVFYQPNYVSPYDGATGRYYEGWKFKVEDPALNGGFPYSCDFGGRMVRTSMSEGRFVSWQFSGYKWQTPEHPDSTYQEKGWGATATSLPLLPGIITWEDMMVGKINHMIGLSVIVARKSTATAGYRWPAQRGDGWHDTCPVLEGMRLYLPPNWEPVSPHPVARMVEGAIRDFGAVIWDKAGALSFRAEPRCQEFFGGTAGYDVLDGFPWGSLTVNAT